MKKILIVMKPDAIERGLVDEIIKRFSTIDNFEIVRKKELLLTRDFLEIHYEHIKHIDAFDSIVAHMTRCAVLALECHGNDNLISDVRGMLGSTFNANRGTIRGDFDIGNRENLVHASDSDENAEIELQRFFGE